MRSFTFLEVVGSNGGQFFLQFAAEGFDGVPVGFGVGQVMELPGVFGHVEEFDPIPAMFESPNQAVGQLFTILNEGPLLFRSKNPVLIGATENASSRTRWLGSSSVLERSFPCNLLCSGKPHKLERVG